jgi:V/A-type H+-transporting ATPase subunit I
MGVVHLAKTSLLVPRSQLDQAARELAKFGWFHAELQHGVRADAHVGDLAQRAYKLSVDLNELIQALAIPLEPGLLDVVFKGAAIAKARVTAHDWADLIQQVDQEAKVLVEGGRGLIDERKTLEKELQDARALRSALELIAGVAIDLSILQRLRRFSITFAIASAKDVREVRGSLPDHYVLDAPLTKTESAVLIAGSAREADRVEKVLRSFEVKPFAIPEPLPQNPREAFEVLTANIERMHERHMKVTGELSAWSDAHAGELLQLREAAQTAAAVLDQLKRAGELQRVARLDGYLPADQVAEFQQRCGRQWLCFVEPVRAGPAHGHEPHVEGAPALLANGRVSRAFETITLTQGPPSYGEADPTPFISVLFPIFFGIMFADLGHGLVLLAFGLLLLRRRIESLRRWGLMIALWGAAAAVVGTLVGEFFGFEIAHLPGLEALGGLTVVHFVARPEVPGEAGIPGIALAALKFMLKISVNLGILHLTMGLVLSLFNAFRRGERVAALVERLPLLGMYLGLVLVMFAFQSAGRQLANLFTSTDATALFFFFPGPTVAVTAVVGVGVLVAFLAVFVAGTSLAVKMGKLPGEGFGLTLMNTAVEGIFERIPGFLSNTISYMRLAILLTVHAALLIALNLFFAHPLYVAVPMVILLNLLVIIMEALIVFIQTLRLHLYEWFTKFYEGSGRLFQRLVPPTRHVEIAFD